MESSARAEAEQPWADNTGEAPDAPWLESAGFTPPPEPQRNMAPIMAAVAAFLWIALVAASFWLVIGNQPLATLNLIDWAALAAGASAPLALIGVILLLRLRWNAMAAEARAGQAARAFHLAGNATHTELRQIEALLDRVTSRINQNGIILSGQSRDLLATGDGIAAQLSKLSKQVAEGSQTLGQQAIALESATTATRVDLGVLLSDLPQAEQRTLAIADALRDAGIDAHSRVGAVAGLLEEIWTRSERAQSDAAIVAQRLTTQIDQLGNSAGSALTRLEDSGKMLGREVDSTLARVASSLETTRGGVDAQTAALTSAVEGSRVALESAGHDALMIVESRIAMIAGNLALLGSQFEELATRFERQEAAGRSLVDGLDTALGGLEQRLAEFARTGDQRAGQLAGQLGTLRLEMEQLGEPLIASEGAARALSERGTELRSLFGEIGTLIGEVVPRGVAASEASADAARNALSTSDGMLEALQSRIAALDAAADAARGTLAEGQADGELAGKVLEAQLAKVTGQLDNLRAEFARVGQEADDVSMAASGSLIETLGRVRETASQAAQSARTTFEAVAEESRKAFAKAGDEALRTALDSSVTVRIEELEEASRRAEAASNAAAERLARQMLTIANTTAAVESRIEEANARTEAVMEEDFARRSALLIESLNSTAIDIAKLFSNEVADTAWAAYLKGDRGVFTRRAVRLLEANDAREIARLYEEDGSFKGQVNRYIHDFEAMLRRVLASRDGGPMSVALLSSDNGKLYVALAQAIERFRS